MASKIGICETWDVCSDIVVVGVAYFFFMKS